MGRKGRYHKHRILVCQPFRSHHTSYEYTVIGKIEVIESFIHSGLYRFSYEGLYSMQQSLESQGQYILCCSIFLPIPFPRITILLTLHHKMDKVNSNIVSLPDFRIGTLCCRVNHAHGSSCFDKSSLFSLLDSQHPFKCILTITHCLRYRVHLFDRCSMFHSDQKLKLPLLLQKEELLTE